MPPSKKEASIRNFNFSFLFFGALNSPNLCGLVLVSSSIPGEQLFTMNSSPPTGLLYPMWLAGSVRGRAYRVSRIGQCSRGQEVWVFFPVFLRVSDKPWHLRRVRNVHECHGFMRLSDGVLFPLVMLSSGKWEAGRPSAQVCGISHGLRGRERCCLHKQQQDYREDTPR